MKNGRILRWLWTIAFSIAVSEILGQILMLQFTLVSQSGREKITPIWFLAPDYKPGKSLEAITKALKTSPDDPALHFDLGVLYAQSGQWQKALLASLRLIQLDPVNINGYLGTAYAYANTGRPDRALQVIEKGLQHPKIYGEIKTYLYRTQGDIFMSLYEQRKTPIYLSKAEKAYKSALYKNPGMALAFIGLARINICRNRFSEAMKNVLDAQKFQKTDREKALVLYYQGLLAEKRGDIKSACRLYEKALNRHTQSFKPAKSVQRQGR